MRVPWRGTEDRTSALPCRGGEIPIGGGGDGAADGWLYPGKSALHRAGGRSRQGAPDHLRQSARESWLVKGSEQGRTEDGGPDRRRPRTAAERGLRHTAKRRRDLDLRVRRASHRGGSTVARTS